MAKKKQDQRSRTWPRAITVSEALGAFERAFRASNPNEVEQLLREMVNVQVAVVDNKQEAEKALSRGKKLKTVTVPYGVFLGKAKTILQERNFEGEDPGIYCLEPSQILDDTSSTMVLTPIYSLEAVRPGKTYVLLSSLAGYSALKGLTFSGQGDPTGFEDQSEAEGREKFTGGRFQTWKEHMEGVWDRSKRLTEIYRPFVKSWARNALAPQWSDDSDQTRLDDFVDTILWAMKVAVLFHDIGKLRAKWQQDVWEYEKTLTGKTPGSSLEERFIARTSPPLDEERRRKRPRIDPHARYAYPFVSTFLRSLLGESRFLESSIALAAARHHSLEVLGSVESGEFALAEGVQEFLKDWLPQVLEIEGEEKTKVLQALEESINATQSGSLADEPPSPSDDFYFLYCLTNRMVKVADWEDAGSRTVELHVEATGHAIS